MRLAAPLLAAGLLLLAVRGGSMPARAGGAPVVPPRDNLYAASYSGKGVTHFSVGSTGALQYEEFLPTGDAGPWNVAMTPDGLHLFVANYGGSDVSLLDVQPDGTLAAHAPDSVTVEHGPYGIAVSPDGKNLYVANHHFGLDGSISTFALDGAGTPTEVGSAVPTDGAAYALAVSPDGSSVYVTLDNRHEVEMFDRAADGTLTPKATETVPTVAGGGPSSISITPDGRYAYVADYNTSDIVGYLIDAGGELEPLPQGPVTTGYGTYQMVVSPDGRSLYATSCCGSSPQPENTVWQFTIDPATGTLTPKLPAYVALQFGASNMWLSADGTSAYVSTSDYPPTHNQIEQFDVAPDGTLGAKAVAAVPADSVPSGIVIPPDQGPTAGFTAAPGAPGAPTTFDASTSSDTDGTVTEYDWSFGDGTSALDGGATPSHTYAAAGSYVVTLHVADDSGCSTDTVFTGQTDYCAGNAGAEVRHTVVVTGSAPPTTTTSTPSPPPPPPTTTTAPPPPVPGAPFGTLRLGRFAVAKSAMLKHSVWLGAAQAAPSLSAAQIANVQWDTDGNGTFELSCGRLRAASIGFSTAGNHTVGLRVTDVAGQVGQTTQTVTVTAAEASNDARFGVASVSDCEDPGANEQPDRSDCVKSFSFGLVDVNSQGDRNDCFEITSRLRKGATTIQQRVTQGASTPGYFAYRAVVKGPVVINGLYVPIPEKYQSVYDSGKQTIGAGEFPLRFGTYKTLSVPLDLTITPDAHGVFHLGDIPLGKGIGAIGGLKVDANVSIDLLYRQSRITYHLSLPSIFNVPGDDKAKGPQGDLVVYVRNGSPFSIQGAKLGPTDVAIGPLLIKDLQFSYDGREDSWSGGADVFMPGAPIGIDAAPPPADKGFGMKHGKFDHAGIGVSFPDAAEPPVFPGLFLKHMDVAIGVDPLRFEGSAGFDAAHVADVDGEVFVAFASPGAPYTVPNDGGDLSPLAGRVLDDFSIAIGGTVSIKVPVIDQHVALYNGYLLYEAPSLFEFAGGFKFDVSFLHVEGGAKGFLDGGSGKWSMEGGVQGCLRDIEILGFPVHFCQNVGAVVSSKGVGFCTSIPIPTPPFGIPVPVDVGVGYDWGGTPTPMIWSCDYGPWRETVPRATRSTSAARVGPQTLELASGLPSAELRLEGGGGAPDAVVTEPDGTSFSTDRMPGDSSVEVLKDAGDAVTIVAVRRPRGGTWTVTPKGAVPLTGIASADGLPAPNVKAQVSGSGLHRTLRYSLTPAPGRVVTFEEHGAGASRVLGTATAAQGTLRVLPAPGPGGVRRIVAVVDQDGMPAHSVEVASYRVAAPRPPARPTGLHAARGRSSVAVRWRRVAGASRYSTTIRVGGRVRRSVVTRRPAVTIGWLDPRRPATIAVRAIGPTGNAGRPATVTLRKRR